MRLPFIAREFEATPAMLAANAVNINFGMIDDEGWSLCQRTKGRRVLTTGRRSLSVFCEQVPP